MVRNWNSTLWHNADLFSADQICTTKAGAFCNNHLQAGVGGSVDYEECEEQCQAHRCSGGYWPPERFNEDGLIEFPMHCGLYGGSIKPGVECQEAPHWPETLMFQCKDGVSVPNHALLRCLMQNV